MPTFEESPNFFNLKRHNPTNTKSNRTFKLNRLINLVLGTLQIFLKFRYT